MVNKGDHSSKYKSVGTGAGTCGNIKTYMRGNKSFRSR